MHRKSYYIATLIGLFPAQAINVYIGSSLRSMHDVFNNHSTALASYSMFAVQVQKIIIINFQLRMNFSVTFLFYFSQ